MLKNTLLKYLVKIGGLYEIKGGGLFLELALIKQFLKIDYQDDDELLEFIKKASIEFIREAVGYYDENRALDNLLLINLIACNYENRQYLTTEKLNTNLIVKSIIRQLQLKNHFKKGDDV